MKHYNINDHMYVQITEKGWKYLRKTVGLNYINHSINPYAVEIKGKIWYRLQCHEVFDILNDGFHTFINTNVMFDENELK